MHEHNYKNKKRRLILTPSGGAVSKFFLFRHCFHAYPYAIIIPFLTPPPQVTVFRFYLISSRKSACDTTFGIVFRYIPLFAPIFFESDIASQNFKTLIFSFLLKIITLILVNMYIFFILSQIRLEKLILLL